MRVLVRTPSANRQPGRELALTIEHRHSPDRRSGDREKPEPVRQLYVLCAMRESRLLVNALLVRVDRLRADQEPFADLWRRVALSDESKHVSLAGRQLVIAL